MDVDDLHYTQQQSNDVRYGQSKCGNLFFSSEFARRYADTGIVSVAFNPGNLKTALLRHVPTWKAYLFVRHASTYTAPVLLVADYLVPGSPSTRAHLRKLYRIVCRYFF